jgi:hypothetical protein
MSLLEAAIWMKIWPSGEMGVYANPAKVLTDKSYFNA